MNFNKIYFLKTTSTELPHTEQKNMFSNFKHIKDLTYLLEKLNICKTTNLILDKVHCIKIQESIFNKYIIFLNKTYTYNIYTTKYNTLINLHKYLNNKFPIFIFNINITNNMFLHELKSQINYIQTNAGGQSYIHITKYQLINSLKSIEYIFELYSPKHCTNLVSPTLGYILNFNKSTQYMCYVELPLQNLTHNLSTTILSCATRHTVTYFKTINTLTVGGEVFNLDTFSPHLVTAYYYNTLTTNTTLYTSAKNTSLYSYNLILESLLKQYKYQGILLPSLLFELIVKRMVCYVKILNGGDTFLTHRDIVSSTLINLINQSFISNGLIGSFYSPTVLGISKISLGYSGLLSSISFQETLKSLSGLVLTNQIDWILDLKAKIILSDLLDTGTGWYKHYNLITKNFKSH